MQLVHCATSEAHVVLDGKVGSQLRITITARVRDALGIQPGDAIRFELQAGSVRLRAVRPALEDVLEAVWAKRDLGDLSEATDVGAVAFVRELRGWDAPDGER